MLLHCNARQKNAGVDPTGRQVCRNVVARTSVYITHTGGSVVYRLGRWTCDSRLQVRILAMTLAGYFWDRWPYFAGKLSWDVTTTQVNSALHPSGVAKSSTSFGWGKGGKVTSAGWQVTLCLLCDLIWHVISRSGVVISITNCYIRLTLLYFTLLVVCDLYESLIMSGRLLTEITRCLLQSFIL